MLAIAALPLAFKAPYLWKAWTSSPLDRARLELYGLISLVAVAAGAAAFRRLRCDSRSGGTVPAIFVGLAAAVFAIGVIHDVNAIQLIAGVGILWSAGWLLFGGMAAGLFAPAALFAVLAVPGTLHWMQSASAAFVLAPLEPVAPEFSADSQPGMLGRELPPSPGFTRFFKTSSARQFIYANPSNSVAVLAVTVGDDIHEIHPATHCLRSAGWMVVSEKLSVMERPDGGSLEVDEAVVESFDSRMLVWIWYSCDDASTGSFLNFRRMYSGAARWRAYQIATLLADGDTDAIDDARDRMRIFLGLGGGE